MQLMMLEEQMSGPQAVRYDDVYYPRTDKRAISKSICLEHRNFSIRIISTNSNAYNLLNICYRGESVHVSGQQAFPVVI